MLAIMNAISGAVGRNLQAVRVSRGLSLSDLARRSGVTKGTISKLERGVDTNPTIETLWALADAMGLHLSDLVAIPRPAIRVERAGDAQWIGGEGLAARVLDRLSNREVHDIAEVSFEPGHRRQAGLHVRGTMAHIYVIQGSLTAGPDDATMDLASGDYASFPADVPHTYLAPDGPARAVVVMSMLPNSAPSPNGYISGSLLTGSHPSEEDQ